MPTTLHPNFTIQTGTLWASGDGSTFSGTGGPAAFDPFLGEFSDIVSSTGLASEPILDALYNVDAGDQVTFVIAIQNLGLVAGYDLKLRDTLPVGFALAGADLTVTDGAGNLLAFTGNLFDPAGGMLVTAPLPAFDPVSGANVLLVTFTAYATNTIALPTATLSNTAQIVSYAASSGGANLSGSSTSHLSANTPIQTSTFAVTSTANQPAGTLQAGRTVSFDITIALPEGRLRDLKIDEILPQVGTSWLELVSVDIVSIGSRLTTSAPVMVQPDGTIQLGTVVDAADNLATPADDIVIRVTARGSGTTAGTGSISTVVSTADPNGGTARISQTVTNTVTLGTPDTRPTLTGTSTAQFATISALILPFQTLALVDPDVTQTQTLTIHLSNGALGTLSGPGLTTNPAGDYVLTGTVDVVQALADALLFTPSGVTGTETFDLTLDDGAGGIATGQAALTLAPAVNASSLAHFPVTTQTVLTSTATGTSTYAQVEAYAGAIGNLNTQYLYDGDTPLAIVAQQSGMLISSHAQATAIQLKDGANVLDMQQGSSFLVSGTNADTFLLHADQAQATWNTISNFHSGDNVTLYGFTSGTSSKWWDADAGAANYTGATLRLDVDGDGTIDSSLTFAGKTTAETSLYPIVYGSVGNSNFISLTAL